MIIHLFNRKIRVWDCLTSFKVFESFRRYVRMISVAEVSPGSLLTAGTAGLVSGFGSATLVAMIHQELTGLHASEQSQVYIFLAVCILVATSRILSRTLVLRLAQNAEHGLRMHLTRRILETPLEKLEDLGTNRLYTALTYDVYTITACVISLPGVIIDTTIVLGCLVYLAILSVPIFMVVSACLIFFMLSYILPIRRARRHLSVARDEQDQLYKHFNSLSQGLKELKMHRKRRYAFTTECLQESSCVLRNRNISGRFIYTITATWGEFLFFVLIGLLVFDMHHGVDTMSHTASGYAITILYMMGPLRNILGMISQFGRASIALEKVANLGLLLESTEREYPDSLSTRDGKKIELLNVTYSYGSRGSDEEFTLGPLNLSFSCGEVVFIVGDNGSGKSSLAKILTGLYTPHTGQIKMDGMVITSKNREFYRQNFSVVFQDFHIFKRLLGICPEAIDRDGQHYLRLLDLEDKIQLDNGTFSKLDLSLGQQSRLALLVAYLEDRPFYVFDEWASAQHTHFRDQFYRQHLASLKAKGKGIIVISHDDKYFDIADRIIVLDRGKVYSTSNRGRQSRLI